MTKKKETETTETPVVDEVNPLEPSTGASDLPATWDKPEGENLPATRGASAPLEREDFITPKLHLVQKTGDLSVRFPLGTWVLNKEIQLTKALGDPLQVVVLEHPHKFFMEHRVYDPNNTTPARSFNSVEELEAEGLTLDWDNKKNIRPTADRAARVLLLILKPAGLETESGFGMSIEGIGPCAVASWLLVNTSYTTAARRIFTAEKLDLNGKPIYSLVWTLKSVPTKVGGYNIVAPQLATEKRLTDEAQVALQAAFSLA
jgi:hypothetical protein